MDDATLVPNILKDIVAAGMEGATDRLQGHLHDDVTMVLPGFGGRIEGRASMVGSFVEFSENAGVDAHGESDEQIDIIGDVAVGSYRFEVTYSRDGGSWRSGGRDLWIFRKVDGRWLAVWRTMLELVDEPVKATRED